MSRRKQWLIALLGLAFALAAQPTASLTIRLVDPTGAAIAGAEVVLENRASGWRRILTARSEETVYSTENIPPQSYRLSVTAPGFAGASREVVLRSAVPVVLEIPLAVASERDTITVSASAVADLVDPQSTGTSGSLSFAATTAMPSVSGSRGLESYLLAFPGFAMNANGAIHPRGAHNQMTYVVDGLPISDQLTGAFATSLDPNMVENLQLYTGNIPPEFGAKVSGVASITTRSGLGSGRKLFGLAQWSAGRFNAVDGLLQTGGERGRLGWFASVSGGKSARFLDQVSLDNLHNGGNAERAFVRLDYQPGQKDTLHFHAMTGRSSFELANLRSQHAVGMGQRQLMKDLSVWLRWDRTLGPRTAWQSTLGYRPTVALLLPSHSDTPVTAAQSRHLSTVTLTNRWNAVLGRHTLRVGMDGQLFPVSEDFSFGITDPRFNAPCCAGFNDGLAPYDLTRGGRLFAFTSGRTGSLVSGFLQDSIVLGRWALNLGIRFDSYRLLVRGSQWQPRLGIAYHLRESGTVIRLSYNRNFQTPPNENLLLSSSAQAAALAPLRVRQAAGGTVTPLKAQRENVYEGGVQQALFGKASLDVALYHKDSIDQQDNNNFFNTGIIFPVTLAKIRVNGAEARLNLPPVHGFSVVLSATHARAISTPPFSGGLFLGQEAVDALTAGPFVIDHDQRLSAQASAHYIVNRSWWVGTVVRHDSGLVANPSNPAVVAADPDYNDLLPYVNLDSAPARVRPHTITNISLGYSHEASGRKQWDVQAELQNALNVIALHSFQSVFVGTRLVVPRAFSVKLRWYW